VIAVPAPAPDHRADVAIDRLHLPERDRLMVGKDPVQVAEQQAGELLESWQSLPAQGAEPGGQEPPGPPLVVAP
jgi:hypothetical protein